MYFWDISWIYFHFFYKSIPSFEKTLINEHVSCVIRAFGMLDTGQMDAFSPAYPVKLCLSMTPFCRLFQWLFVSHTEFLCKHHIKFQNIENKTCNSYRNRDSHPWKGDNSIIRLTSYFWFWGSASRFRSTFIRDILLGRKPWYYGAYWISPWKIWSQSCDINL